MEQAALDSEHVLFGQPYLSFPIVIASQPQTSALLPIYSGQRPEDAVDDFILAHYPGGNTEGLALLQYMCAEVEKAVDKWNTGTIRCDGQPSRALIGVFQPTIPPAGPPDTPALPAMNMRLGYPPVYYAWTVCNLVQLCTLDVLLDVRQQAIEEHGRLIKLGADQWTLLDSITLRPVSIATVNEHFVIPHSCYEATYQPWVSYFCYPRIIVAGVPKCGTSALYNALEAHQSMHGSEQKENCVYPPHDVNAVWKYFKKLEAQLSNAMSNNSGSGIVLLSGCVLYETNLAMQSWLRNPLSTYILLTRDVADAVWASYNFWCDMEFDAPYPCINYDWTNPATHHRSPESFHHLIVAHLNKNNPYLAESFPRYAKKIFLADLGYRDVYNMYITAGVDPSRVLVLASEEMQDSVASVWRRIMERMDMPSAITDSHPSLNSFDEIRYNAGASLIPLRSGWYVVLTCVLLLPGGHVLQALNISAGNYTPGIYKISHFRPQLVQTRKLIDVVWRESGDCHWTSEMTGYRYPVCAE